jgi:hypothetical protein
MKTFLILTLSFSSFLVNAQQDSMRAFVTKAVEERNLVVEITHIEQGGLKELVPKGYFLVLTDSTVKASLPRFGGEKYYSPGAAFSGATFLGRFISLDGIAKNYQSTTFGRGGERGYSIRFSVNDVPVRSDDVSRERNVVINVGFDGYVYIVTMDGRYHYSGLVRNSGI